MQVFIVKSILSTKYQVPIGTNSNAYSLDGLVVPKMKELISRPFVGLLKIHRLSQYRKSTQYVKFSWALLQLLLCLQLQLNTMVSIDVSGQISSFGSPCTCTHINRNQVFVYLYFVFACSTIQNIIYDIRAPRAFKKIQHMIILTGNIFFQNKKTETLNPITFK